MRQRRHPVYLPAAALAIALLAIAPAPAGAACGPGAAQLDDDAFTIVQITLDDHRYILDEAVMGYEVDSALFLPLSRFAEAVEFPITVEPERQRAEGWFLREDNRFALDLAGHCVARIRGSAHDVDPARIAVQPDDIYVDSRLLEQWFPVTLDYDPNGLLVGVTASEPLPVQQRLEREARWRRLGGTPPDRESPAPPHPVPYRVLDWPVLDASLTVRERRTADDRRIHQRRHRLAGAGDLLGMNARFSVRGTRHDPASDVYATAGRRDPEGRLLGPLRAREYAFGDIGTGRDPLVGRNVLGRGATVSSFPLNRPAEFDRFSLEGPLAPGWEVELYRDNRLLDFQAGDDSERYHFTDIPLRFGVNRFRLVFHGPNGEQREDVVERVIGPGMIRPGEQHYRLTALRENDDQLRYYQDSGGDRLHAAYEAGLTRALSVGGGFRSLTLDDERRDFVTVHANAALPGAFGRLEYADARDGGDALFGLLSTRLAGVDIAGEVAEFSDFDSERTRLSAAPGELLQRSELRLDTRLPRWGTFWTTLGATAYRERGTLGERTSGLTRLTVGGRYGRLTHVFEGTRTETPATVSRRTRHRLLGSRRVGPVWLRGEVVQDLRPETHVSQLGVGADWQLNRRANLRVGVNRAPQRDVTRYSAGINWRFSRLSAGASVQVGDNGEYTATLSLSTSLLRDPGPGRWMAGGRVQSRSAAASVRVFLDENNNGIRDAGEPAIPDVGMRARGAGPGTVTNEHGLALLHGLPTYRPLEITLDDGTLEDPFWTVRENRRQVTLRPGRTAELLMPVLPTGAIEGTIHMADGPRLEPAPNRALQVFNMDGERMERTRTAYDGYYYVEGLTPGYYRVRPGNGRDGRLPEPDDLIVEIRGDTPMLGGMDVILGSWSPVTGSATGTAQPSPYRMEHWLMEQSSGGHVIQLMATGNEDTVRRFIDRHGLRHQAAYFRTQRNGAPWYAVVYGGFDSRAQAAGALRELPERLRAAGPWLRRIGDIQTILREERIRP